MLLTSKGTFLQALYNLFSFIFIALIFLKLQKGGRCRNPLPPPPTTPVVVDQNEPGLNNVNKIQVINKYIVITISLAERSKTVNSENQYTWFNLILCIHSNAKVPLPLGRGYLGQLSLGMCPWPLRDQTPLYSLLCGQ